MDDEYDAGMGTTPGMWEMVSTALDGEKMPESINRALHALCEGRAQVIERAGPHVSPAREDAE